MPIAAKLSRYVVTGGLAAVVDLLGFHGLVTAGVPLLIAAVASWLAAAWVNYVLTSTFVFRLRPTWRRGLAFLIGALSGLAINATVTLCGVSMLGLEPTLAKLVGIGVAFFFNFALNVGVVFR